MASVAGAPTAPAAQGIQKLGSNSSFIAAFEYDPANLTLTTFLKDNSIYQHKFVVPGDWTALQTAQSHGKHWATHIKGKKVGVRIKSAKAPMAGVKAARRSK